ncbi:hypothetical protein LUZ61_006229 [Rhynchospora tenuis]|uniref:DUF1771 domain-containing protein n=1 Tax=Rhynchospora tenuis TaxID=198213 RepID=A0AAD5ZRE6_9POAL|nr:hypothetical protein LUZ61_006229 [Rhynchospora tenuis]
MNLSIVGSSNHMERRLNLSNKTSTSMNTTLNPNAAEFVPSFHRSPNGSGNGNGSGTVTVTGTGVANPNAAEFIPSSLRSPTGNGNVRNSVTATLDRSESSASNTSEEEAHKYWRVQLPDDITPDFGATGEDDLRSTENISLSRLSINDGGLETPVLSPSVANNGNRSLWGKQFATGGKSSMNGREANSFNGTSLLSPGHEINGGSVFSTAEDFSMNPIKFLSLKYPGLSSQTLADIYLRSGQDLSLTVEILTEMESQNLNAKSFSSPNIPGLGSPVNGLYRTLSTPIRGGDTDLSSPASEVAPSWRYRGDGSSLAVGSLGSGRIARNLSYNGTEDMASGGLGSSWLESGDSFASMNLESKEELRNLALLRNVCLEQARQAYLAGNDALSKELTLKGQLYNMQIKAAQEKAREAASQYRSLLLGEVQGFSQENLDRPIDLRGLHASEAIHVLNYELSNRKRTVRSTGRRLEVTILVGPGGGNVARGGSRIPPRLSGAVEQYLFEHGFRCTQTQPGVLSVLIY